VSQFRGCNSTSDLVIPFVALVMKNRVVGSLCRELVQGYIEDWEPVQGACPGSGGLNSTSSLVIMFGALVMKNRVVGSLCRAIWSQTICITRSGSQHRAICRAESQCRGH